MDLFQYVDYRSYLNDYYRHKKQEQKTWSYGVWANKMGLKSPSTLIMLLKGQRNPGDELTKNFIHYFKFKEKEAEYFKDLVQLKKCKHDVSTSVALMEKLAKQRKLEKFPLLDHDTLLSISSWYFDAIRQMVKWPTFTEDPKIISEILNFKVTPKEVKEAIDTMLRLKLLQRDSEGKLRLEHRHTNTSDDIASEGLKRFHEQVLDNATKALRTIEPKERQISGVTMAMKKENLVKAKELIRKFEDDFCALIEGEQNEADSVFQLEIAFFPLTKEKKDKS